MPLFKVLLVFALVIVCAAPTVAFGALSSPNALGLYFDAEAATQDLTLAAPATVDLYLIFTDPTVAFVDAWEAELTISTGAVITGASFPLGTTAGLAGPSTWAVAMSVPMPCNPVTKLAVFSVASNAEQNTFFYLGDIPNPSVPGDLPNVRLLDGSWSAVPVSSGDPTLPVASINASTPNETSSWGSVKSLFR